jgi:hypothetical protein
MRWILFVLLLFDIDTSLAQLGPLPWYWLTNGVVPD